MIRPITAFSFALAAATGFGLYQVKYAVQSVEDRLIAAERQASVDEEAIHVLRANWSQVTQPATLGAMAARHLDLVPVTPAKLASFDTLPLKGDGAETAAPLSAASPLPAPEPAAQAPAVPVAAAPQPPLAAAPEDHVLASAAPIARVASAHHASAVAQPAHVRVATVEPSIADVLDAMQQSSPARHRP